MLVEESNTIYLISHCSNLIRSSPRKRSSAGFFALPRLKTTCVSQPPHIESALFGISIVYIFAPLDRESAIVLDSTIVLLSSLEHF